MGILGQQERVTKFYQGFGLAAHLGVHLGAESLPVAEVVAWCAKRAAHFVVGASCHSLAEAQSAEKAGASYLFFGPVFATPSKLAYGPPQGLQRLEEVCRSVKIPVLAIGGVTLENAATCLRAGASGYVLKQSAPTELIQAIRAAATGGHYLDSTMTARVTAGFLGRKGRRLAHSGAAPSERESEVLRLIAAGYSNKEIATQLELSVKTVEAHKANAMRKLGLNGRIDIVKYAILQGWLKDN